MTSGLIGVSIPQITGREKVVGRAQYVGDLKVAGKLHGKVLRSPYPHSHLQATWMLFKIGTSVMAVSYVSLTI